MASNDLELCKDSGCGLVVLLASAQGQLDRTKNKRKHPVRNLTTQNVTKKRQRKKTEIYWICLKKQQNHS